MIILIRIFVNFGASRLLLSIELIWLHGVSSARCLLPFQTPTPLFRKQNWSLCNIVNRMTKLHCFRESGEIDHGRHWTKDGEGCGRLLVVVQGQQEEGGAMKWYSCFQVFAEGCCQCGKLPVSEMSGSGTLDLWLHWHKEVSFFVCWLLSSELLFL